MAHTDAFAAAPAGPKRKRIPPLAWVGGAVLVVAAVIGIAMLSHHPTHHLTGTFTILDSSGFSHTYLGGSCTPSLGYADIVPYSTVATVRDPSGEVIATATIASGRQDEQAGYPTCQFRFDEGNVPDEDSYDIEVGRRGSVTFTRQQLESTGWRADVTIGTLGGI